MYYVSRCLLTYELSCDTGFGLLIVFIEHLREVTTSFEVRVVTRQCHEYTRIVRW